MSKYIFLLLAILSLNIAYAKKENSKKYTLREIDSLGLMDKSFERDVNTFINSILHYPSLWEGCPSQVVYESDSFIYFGHTGTYSLNNLKYDYIRKIDKKTIQSVFPMYNKVSYNDIKNTITNFNLNHKKLHDSLIGENFKGRIGDPDYVLYKNYIIAYIHYTPRNLIDNHTKSIKYYLDKNNFTLIKVEREPYPYTIEYLRSNEESLYVNTENYSQYIYKMKYGCNKKYGGCVEYMFETDICLLWLHIL